MRKDPRKREQKSFVQLHATEKPIFFPCIRKAGKGFPHTIHRVTNLKHWRPPAEHHGSALRGHAGARAPTNILELFKSLVTIGFALKNDLKRPPSSMLFVGWQSPAAFHIGTMCAAPTIDIFEMHLAKAFFTSDLGLGTP